MRYEMMLPHQIRRAIDENWPVVLPLGVLEYHGEHLAVDMGRLSTKKWYLKSARDAGKELGERGARLVLDHMRRVLGV